MKKLIVNADDFGYCEAVNYAIIKAFQEGIVTSTTMMVNMPGFDHAIELAKQHPELGVGVHMTMTCYKPLLDTHKTLVDEHGYFAKDRKDEFDVDELYDEFKAQIEKIKAAGIHITHLDSHHHVHTIPRLRPLIDRIANEYKLPIRGGFRYDFDYQPQTKLFGKFYMDNVTSTCLEAFFTEMEDDIVYDMMCHPAYIDKFLYESSSYALPRMNELEILISEEVKQLIQKYNIQLMSYREYHK